MTHPGVDVRRLSGPAAPTAADVDRIAAHPDPVVRNLMITHCYHELSRALAAVTGGAANWCTFAVWASKQVGQTIRHEDACRALERLLARSPAVSAAVGLVARVLRRAVPRRALEGTERLVRRAVVETARLDVAGDAAARGNLKVFAEIAREFARFIAEFADDQVPDEQRITAFCATLRPGEPPAGQRHLRQAFARYYRARFTDDPRLRAELLLLANIEIGLHEQTRLQPEIAAALAAPVLDPDELERHLLDALLPDNPVFKRLRLASLTLLGKRDPVRAATERLVDQIRALTRRAVTKALMTLALPNGDVLDLSDDLPATFPPALARLSHPDLLALLHSVDPTADSPTGTAARDWSDLPDRMHYIADMFRCYATRADLLDQPFTPDQVEAIAAGRRPPGRL